MKNSIQVPSLVESLAHPFSSGTNLEFDFAYQLWTYQSDSLSVQERAWMAEHIQQIQLPCINIVWRVTSQMDRFDFEELVDSLKRQMFPQWRLYLLVPLDFSNRMRQIVMDAAIQDARIVLMPDDWVIKHAEVERSLAPVLLIEGEGQLAPHALYLFALQVQAGKEFVYADEDAINVLGRHSPLFKPGYSPELARQFNYFGSFGLVASRHPAAVQAVKGFVNQTVDLAQTFGCLSFLKASQVGHIPFVLLHTKRKRDYVPSKLWQMRAIQTTQALPTADLPSVTVAVADGTHSEHVQHHWVHDAISFKSETSSVSGGIFGLPMKKIKLKVGD